jgi:cytochrome c-type biogenesis protein CcmH/NrfF
MLLSYPPMIRGLLIAAVALVTVTASVPAQAPPADEKRQQMEALGKTLRAQQAEIAANQAKIDEKLAALAEVVRTARIFASRGGR